MSPRSWARFCTWRISGGKNGLAMSVTTIPTAAVRPVDRARACRFGTYPAARAASRTRSTVSGRSSSGREKARDTVAGETPSWAASRVMVGRAPPTRPLPPPVAHGADTSSTATSSSRSALPRANGAGIP